MHPHAKFPLDPFPSRDGNDTPGTTDSVPTLSNNVQLCTLLQSLSHHIQNRTIQLSSSLSQLESKLRAVDYNVNRIVMLDSIQSDYQSTLCHSADDSCTNTVISNARIISSNNNNQNSKASQSKGGQDTDTCSADRSNVVNDNNVNKRRIDLNENKLDTMQKEEDDAIQHGIQALSIFHDHTTRASDPTNANATVAAASSSGRTPPHREEKNNRNSMSPNRYFDEEVEGDMEEEGGDNDDDSFYYYESSPGDIFNQRPLPFVVGSVEFLESVDGGIGVDEHQDEEDSDDDEVDDESNQSAV